MGAPIFLYSLIEINNMKGWFWLKTNRPFFHMKDDFSASWPTVDEWQVIEVWSVWVKEDFSGSWPTVDEWRVIGVWSAVG